MVVKFVVKCFGYIYCDIGVMYWLVILVVLEWGIDLS